ncbi:MAG: BF3164 family lipoprotein [Mangrovibacterium sp.]
MKISYYTPLIILLVSCNIKDQSINFPVVEQASTSICINDLKIGIPDKLFYLDSFFVLNDYKATEDYISLFEMEQGRHIRSFGKKGKGPNEMITPLLPDVNENSRTLTLFDPNLKQMQLWSVDNIESVLLKQIHLDFLKVMLLKAYYVDDNLIIGLGFLKDGLFCLINPKNRTYNIVEDFPIMPYRDGNHELSAANGGRISFFPDHKHFIFSMSDIGYLACYQIENGNIMKTWERWITKPDYKVNNKKIIWSKNNELGFMDVAISHNKIFGLYSGRHMKFKNGRDEENIPNTILVFDLIGNPLKKCMTDVPILRIATDDQGKLFGISLSSKFDLVKINL